MVKVKICGITNIEDAKHAVCAGADALGFVFYGKSPRYIAPENAAGIIRSLPAKVKKVGVFVNANPGVIRRVASMCGLDMVQLHGDESPADCRKCSPYKVIKAFRIRRGFDSAVCKAYKTYGYLFDTYSGRLAGGTGRAFDWSILLKDKFRSRVFLSGGLNWRNIRRAISLLGPDWVDASSSLEKSPGKKDHSKVKSFIMQAKRASIVS
ncbi:MAG: phosphoribosylanthranilate isomerase [Candidatus Omnitrophica bacterium]|jgi:phosphoribosylanthranilate isomerase|nr:phosphoribosylanthranilate isomerase [Candidatus Omnitrophota bacterium]